MAPGKSTSVTSAKATCIFSLASEFLTLVSISLSTFSRLAPYICSYPYLPIASLIAPDDCTSITLASYPGPCLRCTNGDLPLSKAADTVTDTVTRY